MLCAQLPCRKLGRCICTPITSDGKRCKEMLQWFDLPIVNPVKNDHFISPENTKLYINDLNMPFGELKRRLLHAKVDTNEKQRSNTMRKIVVAAATRLVFHFI